MRYMVVIEEGEHSFGAYVTDLPGCVAVGDTKDEVVCLIQEAIAFHLEGGGPLPQPASSSEYVVARAA